MNYNRVVLVGRLTRDIESRTTQSGTTYAKTGIAVSRRFGKDGEKQESVMFIDITAWSKTAEIMAQYCKKGSAVLIEGRLELQQWDDKETGKKRSKHEVTVEAFQFLDKKPATDDDDERPAKKKADPAPDYGDIPFILLLAFPLLGMVI